MTHFTTKWKPEKAQKKLARVAQSFLPGESIWFLGVCNNLRPMADLLALTNTRIVGLSSDARIVFQARYDEIVAFTPDPSRETVAVVCADGRQVVFKAVPRADHGAILHYFQYGSSAAPPAEVIEAREQQAIAGSRAHDAREGYWPFSVVRGKLSRKASEAIARQCRGEEQPWLILTSSGGAGTLAAFDDRLTIITTGALTSFMAGSLGGERSAVFYYTDVTGIEYNSGIVDGVLEVLTPSYSGGGNKDPWRGSNQSRNADSNDPWTLSNCLPLAKAEYNAYLSEIQELQSRISAAKQGGLEASSSSFASTPDGLAEQLERLAQLRDSGVLSEQEFAAAKVRLLG